MFYSHELLHSRKYGVATIWLVATLGSKSTLKKVTRKAILDVDIPKACTTITDPEAPLALRLQASLLYGLSRVHSQQCNYVLNDTQSFRNKMRGIAQVMKDLEINPEVGRTRPEQLNLLEDSAFIPELDLMFDLSAFDLPSDSPSSRASSVLSLSLGHSSQTSHDLDEEAELALAQGSIDTPDNHGGFDFPAGSSFGGLSVTKSAQLRAQYEEPGIIDDPDFHITADGILVAPTPVTGGQVPSIAPMSETGFSTKVREEHEAGFQAQQREPPVDMDEGIIVFDDGDGSPPSPAEPAVQSDIVPSSGAPAPLSPTMMPPPASISTESAAAPQRRARAPRQAQADLRTELQNKDLGDWNNNYLDNMADLARTKEQQRSTMQAKKNAAFWILGQGIGRVQANFGEDREPHPLSVFSGQALLDALMGPQSPPGSKRARSDSQANEDRRVRPRQGDVEKEVARGMDEEGQVLGLDDDGIIMPGDDYPASERGRPVRPSLSDIASVLPWNRSSAHTSRHGSAQPFGFSGGAGISSSVAGVGGLQGMRSSSGMPRSRHGSIIGGIRSRRLSASPLVGRGRGRLPSMDLDDLQDMADRQRLDSADPEAGLANIDDDGFVVMDVDDLNVAGGDDYELYGPAANVDTQTAQTSQWMRQTLEDEALNFLGFVETALGAAQPADPTTVQAEDIERSKEEQLGESRDEISMDELLPPEKNSAIVGAQALLHVLSLVTKGLMLVRQDVPFGEIVLRMVAVDGA